MRVKYVGNKFYIHRKTYGVLEMPNVLTMYQQTKVSAAGVRYSLQPWWNKLCEDSTIDNSSY